MLVMTGWCDRRWAMCGAGTSLGGGDDAPLVDDDGRAAAAFRGVRLSAGEVRALALALTTGGNTSGAESVRGRVRRRWGVVVVGGGGGGGEGGGGDDDDGSGIKRGVVCITTEPNPDGPLTTALPRSAMGLASGGGGRMGVEGWWGGGTQP